jgi:alkyldihydroxyacetonephosphate synthase
VQRRRKFYGWGFEDDHLTPDEIAEQDRTWLRFFGRDGFDASPAPQLNEIRLRPPRVVVPPSLEPFCSTELHDRAFHTYGRAFVESVRMYDRDFSHPPDVVAHPENQQQLEQVVAWCGDVGATMVPFGGGTGVAGGLAPTSRSDTRSVTIDLGRMQRVVEVDRQSLAARIQAGARGPILEEQLKPHGLTLRHFMQSFEFSTLGGWIATRSSGHFATLYTRIDDMVESLVVVTPAGTIETRRLPASGAGPDPNSLFLGSEGTLGLISEAWMRVHKRPVHRSSFAVRFKDFLGGADAVRSIVQAGLHPANCRLIDGNEASASGATDGAAALLLVSFESADIPVEALASQARDYCLELGGKLHDMDGGEAASRWRTSFFRLPYLREYFLPRGIISDTFESAITWDRFAAFHTEVLRATREAIREVTGRDGFVSCRLTHVYPDGPAPYYTVRALGTKGRLAEQYHAIKQAAMDTVIRMGGTTTHHHAVGRAHRRWYDQERPALFASALAAAKQALDPAGLLNPGVLIDPLRTP